MTVEKAAAGIVEKFKVNVEKKKGTYDKTIDTPNKDREESLEDTLKARGARL